MNGQESNEPAQDKLNQLVVFALDEQRYALHLSVVERIVKVVEVTPLPKAPEIVLGVVNLQGRIIPAVNIRKRFGLPGRDVNLSDQLIIASTSRRTVALVADSVSGVVERPASEVIAGGKILPGMEYVEGVAKLTDGMVFIHDLDRFLSLEEESKLDDAVKNT
ncbi:MAG TPA: chemotaxis protein CheW [Terriglobia bacterium]|nr:chemotaxis protein CheW [Terriglobia bacterium]